LGAIEARRKRKFRLAYRARNSAPAAPNLLKWPFQAAYPDEIWMVDVTFIPTRAGWLYLAVLIDLHTRLIVGWSMKDRPNRELVNEALLVVSFEYAVRGGVHGGKAFSCVLEGPQDLAFVL